MEYVDGGDLDDLRIIQRQKRRPFSDQMLWNIFLQACKGLNQIHKCGYLHRDVTPSNMMISKNGVVKIGDFGSLIKIEEAK